MSCKIVRLFAPTVLTALVFVHTVAAQSVIQYDIDKNGVSGSRSLQELYDRTSYFGYTYNETNIILHNDDSSLSGYPFYVFDYYYSWYDGLDSTVTVKSDVEGQKRTIQSTDTRLFVLYNYYDTDITIDGETLEAVEVLPHLIIDKDIVISGHRSVSEDEDGYNYLYPAGGIEIYNGGILEADGVTFTGNYQGAIITQFGTISLKGATFENNLDDGYYYGGAISSYNSNIDLRGANLTGNVTSSYGGAVYFQVGEGETATLQLGSYEGKNSEISGNFQFYDFDSNTGHANSITFNAGTGSLINVLVDVDKNAFFNLRDPMYGYTYGGVIHFEKTGEGTWSLEDYTDFRYSEQTIFDIKGGTLQLLDGASMNLTYLDQANGSDGFYVYSGATLEIGEGYAGQASQLTVNNFRMEQGSHLVLDNELVLQLRDETGNAVEKGRIGATISGRGSLTKKGESTLTFTGKTDQFYGDLNIDEGTLKIDSGNSFITDGTVNFADNTTLMVALHSQTPNIQANKITIGENTRFTVTGIMETVNEYVILQADQAIANSFVSESVDFTSPVDYLRYDFGFSADRTQFLGKATLAWDFTDGTAHGTFFIEGDSTTGAPDSFTISQNLDDKAGNANWDGSTLTKSGTGTLELAAYNSYSGPTVVEQGTLLLTHSYGAGQSTIQLNDDTQLVLDFQDRDDADFDNRIQDTLGAVSGGKLVKKGKGTVRLTDSSNSYSGGTRIEEGTIEFVDAGVLGVGDIEFAGGQLRNTASGTFNQDILTEAQKGMARFETADKTVLEIVSEISGTGGLIKSGSGTLKLSGSGTYLGETRVQSGTLVVTQNEAIGLGSVILADGTTFRSENTGGSETLTIARDFVLEKAVSGNSLGNTFETKQDLLITGDLSGKGMLIKKGTGNSLALSGTNTYSGGTRLDEGAVSISKASNLGTGPLIFNGGVLQNTAEIDSLSANIVLNEKNSARFQTDKNLTLNSSITGEGGLVKTGGAALTLNGTHTYSGNTLVQEGTLAVNQRINSKTIVGQGAVLTGGGTIGSDVVFEEGSVYQWYCGNRIADSPFLTVTGNISLSGAIFRPVTAGNPEFFVDPVEGRTALRYLGSLTGSDERFIAVDDSLSPFYRFGLDYSQNGLVRVTAERLDEARALSDSVAMGLMIAQRRAHRRTFDRIDRTFRDARFCDAPLLRRRSLENRQQSTTLGQGSTYSRNIWGDLYGRSTKFESTYYRSNRWRLNSFGFQAGYSFNATSELDWGVTGGVELPELKNFRDKIEASDGFLGLYYGRRIQRLWEFKGYIGGGSQRYKLHRNDSVYTYRTRYYGESFQTNIELGRPMLMANAQLIFRPYVGFDLEYASQQAAFENRVSTEYRQYSKSSLTQLFARVGFDLEKRGSRGDGYLGIAYANMIAGDSTPSVGVYYPSTKMKTTIYGSKLGQNVFTIRAGGNLHINGSQARTLFVNLTSDVYADRAGGQYEFSGSIGYDHRF